MEQSRILQTQNGGTMKPKKKNPRRRIGRNQETNKTFKLLFKAVWMLTALSSHRVRSMSVATARCSDLSTASRSHFSSSARTPVVLPGPFSSDDSTARVSLRYARRNSELRTAFFYPLSLFVSASMIENDEGHCFVHAHVYYPSLCINADRSREEI